MNRSNPKSAGITIGVVLVVYRTGRPILDCLDSLLAENETDLRILLVDNGSPDDTVDLIEAWAKEGSASPDGSDRAPKRIVVLPEGQTPVDTVPRGAIGLVRSPTNLGFAGGVNLGLRTLSGMEDVDCFWILNPDCVVDLGTPQKLARQVESAGEFGIIGGRIFYLDHPDVIQSDGGKVNFWTGTCVPFNIKKHISIASQPQSNEMDYVSGAHMLVSREFYSKAGPMNEAYFLFYEEVDWCLRREKLSLIFNSEASVHHVGGATIGSETVDRGPSPLAAYFMARNRLRFIAGIRPVALPVAFIYGLLKIGQMFVRGQYASGLSALRGSLGLRPARSVRNLISSRREAHGKKAPGSA